MARKKSRRYLSLGVITLIGAALALAFWPRPMPVDIGKVERGPMIVTIDEEGRTRVHDAYVVSTPVAGRLLRVDAEPGDSVVGGESIVAVMLPNNPSALDVRSKAQARAKVDAAEAALNLTNAELNRVIADKKLADSQLKRTSRLAATNLESQASLDRAMREAHATEAALQSAKAAIAERQAELVNARALLITFRNRESADAESTETIDIHAPITGLVLRVIQESEATLPVGAPVMEIGNIDTDLEVLVELLSSDAVQISPGDKVIFKGWGGSNVLNGMVERVDPWGFTKVSALGVEEQRVNTIIRFTDSPEARKALGHGFRIEVQIIVWEDKDALIVPSSALFRDGGRWSVFVVASNAATLRQIKVGQNNGIEAQVLGGLEPGERVVLYPSSELTDGIKVTQRVIKR